MCVVGVKLSSLLGKKGSLDKLQSYWDVGFFLGASILACDNTRVLQASEKLFKLKAPIWYVQTHTHTHIWLFTWLAVELVLYCFVYFTSPFKIMACKQKKTNTHFLACSHTS